MGRGPAERQLHHLAFLEIVFAYKGLLTPFFPQGRWFWGVEVSEERPEALVAFSVKGSGFGQPRGPERLDILSEATCKVRTAERLQARDWSESSVQLCTEK